MSAFDTDQTKSGEQPEDFVLKLKEAKGENWENPQTIAKGYLNAQQHIDTLEQELAELKQEKEKGAWTADVLAQLGQRQPASGDEGQGEAGSSGDATPAAPSEEDIKSLIVTTITEQEKHRTAESNLGQVDDGLRTLYGTEAQAELTKRAAELQMPVEDLKQLAERSPTAFWKLFGEAPTKETNASPGSQVNTSGGFNQSDRKNWGYYQKMRKENPQLYRSIQVQNELLEERKKQGDAFYS